MQSTEAREPGKKSAKIKEYMRCSYMGAREPAEKLAELEE